MCVIAELFDVVILSSVEWGAAWQRHHCFAAQWARAGHRVFFVENTGSREPGLGDLSRVAARVLGMLRGAAAAPAGVSVLSPLVLPPTRRLFREINAALLAPRLVDQLHVHGLSAGAVVFAYLPTATTLAVLDRLESSLVVYDCVDHFAGLAVPPPDLRANEDALLSRAALVLTTSRTLFEDKKGRHDHVVELHHGVGSAFFLPPAPERPRRKLCYFGTVWRALDYGPIIALAEAGFDVEMIGPVKEAPPPLPPTVTLRGRVPHEKLPALLSGFDILLLPYADDEYNRGVIPAKTYECLATGRPVLASPLPALAGLADVLTVCRTPQEWVAAAQAPDTAAARAARVERARAHAEEGVFSRLRLLVDEARGRRPAVVGPASRRRALLAGLGWIGLLYGAARAASLLSQMLAGRWLGPGEYGRASLVLAAASYLQIIPMLGFPMATSKLLAEEIDEGRRARLISTALAAFLAWAAVSLPLLAWAHRWLEAAMDLPPELFVPAAVLATATALSHVASSPLLGLKRFADRGLTETLYGFAAPVLLVAGCALVAREHRVMIYALVGGLLMSSAYGLWLLRRYLRFAFEFSMVLAVARFAATASLALLASACVVAPARLFLHRHGGPQDVGLFSAYFTTTVQVSLALLSMLQAVLIPMASGEDGQREIWALFRRGAAFASGAAWLVFAAAAWGGLALFGRSYALDAGWVAVFSGAAALILLHGTASALYAARDVSGLRISVAGTLAAGLANATLTAMLVPLFGIIGAAVSLALSFGGALALYGAFAAWERARA